MEYQKICKFKYNNENYQLLLDNNNRTFFLKINGNGKYKYITLEEYLKLSSIFLKDPKILNAKLDKNNKVNIIPKIILGGTSLVLSLGLLVSCSGSILNDVNNETRNNIESSLSFEVADIPKPLEEDTYVISNTYRIIHINDSEHVGLVLENTNPTKQDLINAVIENSNISDDFRPYLLEYIEFVTSKYPNIEYRVFHENLKTLKVNEVSEDQLVGITMSTDSVACYDIPNNRISVIKGNTYKKGSKDYQVLFHEISHALRTKWFDYNDYTVKIQSWGSNLNLYLVDEILNSLFTISLYDDEVLTEGNKDILYQLQSNYFIALIDSLDNYSIEDYVNYSVSHLAKAMDESHGDTNYGSVILQIINAQYEDYHDDQIEIEQSEFYPLYDYLCDLYFAKYINEGMSYDEAKAVCDKLVGIITYDVPKKYNIDTNHFYEYLNNYCETIGISPYAR